MSYVVQKAIELLRKVDWCYGCHHFNGIYGCGADKIEECTEENDCYDFEGYYEEKNK